MVELLESGYDVVVVDNFSNSSNTSGQIGCYVEKGINSSPKVFSMFFKNFKKTLKLLFFSAFFFFFARLYKHYIYNIYFRAGLSGF